MVELTIYAANLLRILSSDDICGLNQRRYIVSRGVYVGAIIDQQSSTSNIVNTYYVRSCVVNRFADSNEPTAMLSNDTNTIVTT